jgi:hypothetical protein
MHQLHEVSPVIFTHPGCDYHFRRVPQGLRFALQTLKSQIANVHLGMMHQLVYLHIQIMTAKVAQSYRAKIAVQEARFQKQIR